MGKTSRKVRWIYKEIEDMKYLFDESNKENIDKLIDMRVEACMQWYIKKACHYRIMFYVCSFLAMLCPLVIPLVETIDRDNLLQWQCVIIVLGIISSVSTGLLSLFQAREKWINYRSSAEFLKRETMLYRAGVDKYRTEDRRTVYIGTIEKYMSDENVNWQEIQEKEPKSGQ